MEDVVRKIAALMAKANGTENEHEAAVFAAKAHELLAKHNLSMMDVLQKNAEAKGEAVKQTSHGNKYVGGWRTALMGATCEFYFCKLLIQRYNGKSSFIIVGKPHNAAVASSMFDYLEKTTVRLGWEWMRAEGAARKDALVFHNACGLRIAQRLRTMTIERATAVPSAEYKGTTMPALYDNERQAIIEFMEGVKLGKGRASRGINIGGVGGAAGREAGNRVSLNTQVSQSSSQRRLA